MNVSRKKTSESDTVPKLKLDFDQEDEQSQDYELEEDNEEDVVKNLD